MRGGSWRPAVNPDLGVGEAMRKRLAADGIATWATSRDGEETTSGAATARWTAARAASRGDDLAPCRGLAAQEPVAETTFAGGPHPPRRSQEAPLAAAEKVSPRPLKAERIGARTIAVKLKRADFRIRTRSTTLAHATQMAETMYRAGVRLVEKEVDGTPWRLIGIGTANYVPAEEADPPDLADPRSLRRRDVERAIDSIRERFGEGSIGHGRGLR